MVVPGDEVPAAGPDLRLVPAALAAWAGAWWATGAGSRSVLAAAALAAGAASVVLLHGRRPGGGRRRRAVALALALTAVVLAVAGPRLAAREASPVRGWAADRAVARLEGRVATDPRRIEAGPGGAQRWVLRLARPAVEARGGAARAAGPIVVIGGEPWAHAVVGTTVRVTGQLLPPQGGADVAVAGFVAHGPPVVSSPGPRVWQVAEHLRAGLRRACEGLPAAAAGLLPALVVGDTSRLPAEVEADLMTAGMTHLTAVSGDTAR